MIGFDYMDHVLDVVVDPDRSAWRWKDEDELKEAVERGSFSPDEALAIRAEAERGLTRLLDREPPFDRDWERWRPDPSWVVPQLPPDWENVDR